MRGRSEPEQPDAIATLHPGDAQAAESDDARAQKRRELLGGQRVRQCDTEIGACNGVPGIAAIYGVPGENRCVAEIFQPPAAEIARAVGAPEPRNSETRARLHIASDNLVARDDGIAQ